MPFQKVTDPEMLAHLNQDQSLVAPNPMYPLERQGKTVEVQKNTATLPYDVQKAKNDATSSGIKVQSDKLDYNIKMGIPPGDPTKYGADYIATLPSGVQDLTQAMLNGNYKGAITTSRNPVVMQAAIAAQHATHGQFDAGKYDERLALIKGIASDPNSPLNALNTALAHAGVLYDHAPDVAGTSALGYTPFSTGANAAWNSFHGSSPAVSTYNDIVGKYGPEQAKAYGVGTGGERQGIEQQYSANLPLETKKALLATDAKLYAGKIAAIGHGYDMLGANNPLDYLSSDAKAALQKIAPDTYKQLFGAGGNSDNSTQPPPAASPPPGGGDTPPTLGGPPSPPSGPKPDYSTMVGGPQQSVATQAYRNQYDPIVAGGLNALIHKGASLDQANAYLASHGYPGISKPADAAQYNAALAYAKQPGHQGVNLVDANRAVPTTLGERLSASAPAAAIAGFGAGSTAGLQDVAGRALAGPEWDANRQALAALNPKADLLGNVAGGATAMLAGGNVGANLLRAGESGGAARNTLAWLLKNPVKANAAGDTLYGTTYGASENPDNPLQGAALGAIVSPVASLAGSGASKVLGNIATGVTDPAVQRLKDAGIPLTVGEVLGPGAKKAQDAFSNIFPAIGKRYQEGRQAFNQAAFDQAGAPINANTFGTGQTGINALNDAKKAAYNSALDPVNINLNTPQFVGDMKNALNTAANINPAELPEGFAVNQLRTSIGNQIADDGTMSGSNFQAAYRGLSRAAGNASNKVEGYDVGQALGQGQDALVNALSSDNPGAYNDFLNANRANRNLNVLSSAVNAAKNQDGQLFTPNQLGTAATANARTYGGQIAAAGGYRPFNQLINDANSVMSSKLGDSGTFARLLAGNALLEGGGALGGYGKDGGNGALEGAEGGLGLYTLGSLLGSRAGQKLLVGSLINRPEAARTLGDLMINNPRYLASTSTAAQVPYFTTP